MKKWILCLGSFFLGIVFTIVLARFLSKNENETTETEAKQEPKTEEAIIENTTDYNGGNYVEIFNNPERTFNANFLYVTDVVSKKAALVTATNMDLDTGGLRFLLVNNEGKQYYNNESISVPKEKAVVQIGIYRYLGSDNNMYTVPIIKIVDKSKMN